MSGDAAALDPRLCVPDWLRARAERHGDREAIAGSGERLSFAELERRSGRLACGLLAAGVGKGGRVGLLLPNGPGWLVAWLAATRIGAVAVPLNTFFKARELGWMLRHADVAQLLLTPRFLSHDYVERLVEIAAGLEACGAGALHVPELPYLRGVWSLGREPVARGFCGTRDALDAAADAQGFDDAFLRRVEAEVVPADPVVILYSSGSTADPKGAIHTHGALLRQAAALAGERRLGPGDRVWSPMPYFWVGGLVYSLLSNFDAGACTLAEEVFDPERTLAFLEEERATHAVGWPHFGKALAEHPSRARRDLSSLRVGNLPGLFSVEQVPEDPQLRAGALGMTETCGPHTWGGEAALPEALRGTIGGPFAGFEHRIVNPETGAALPPGEPGEVQVRGARVMQGLHRREREEVFTADGFYPTGDGGSFDARGLLRFQGRLGEMIKTSGANVTPSEVEAALLAGGGIKAAYVVGVPDADLGQLVVAAVVPETGHAIDPEELRRRVAKELASYKVPRHVFVESAEALPFTDTGKPNKRRLAELLAARLGRS